MDSYLRESRSGLTRRAAIFFGIVGLVILSVSATVPARAAASTGLAPAAASPGGGDPAAEVDPMIGTGNGGGQVGAVNTYPGPDAPFGMIQWGRTRARRAASLATTTAIRRSMVSA